MKRPEDDLRRTDHERHALGDVQEWPANVVRARDLSLWIGDERKRGAHEVGEATLRRRVVGADADDAGAELLELRVAVAKGAGLAVAAGRERAREEEDDRTELLRLLGQPESLAMVVDRVDLGCRAGGGEHRASLHRRSVREGGLHALFEDARGVRHRDELGLLRVGLAARLELDVAVRE